MGLQTIAGTGLTPEAPADMQLSPPDPDQARLADIALTNAALAAGIPAGRAPGEALPGHSQPLGAAPASNSSPSAEGCSYSPTEVGTADPGLGNSDLGNSGRGKPRPVKGSPAGAQRLESSPGSSGRLKPDPGASDLAPPAGEDQPALIAGLGQRLRQVRQSSVALIEALQPEDLCLQGMADASPPKWHLGHSTWFFETFLLTPHLPGWQGADPRWGYLFNSYYDAVGARHPRPQRGLLTRPPIEAVLTWRQQVDQGLDSLLERLAEQSPTQAQPLQALLELGLQHEQQHQELLLMDLLDGFSRNPLEPVYRDAVEGPEAHYRAANLVEAVEGTPGVSPWRAFAGGLVEIGHDPGDPAFHFDNEAPRHRQWLEPFEIATALVSNADMEAFIAEGGYRRPELWMSEGWAVVQQRLWQAPRYWRGDDEFSLAGLQPRRPRAPVRHLSWFEADAFARWAGARLPSEAEWEHAQQHQALPQAFAVLWQWTSSPYRPYPGFSPAAGAVGEYNGKFMSSQFVLRGSSYLTPADHNRLTYRNFFPPASRWMAAGLRLAR